MAPSKKYVALAEVVKKWNRSEDEIICWANDCEFFLSSSQTLLQRDGSRYIGWVIIPPAALGGYLSGRNSIACSRFFRMEDQPHYHLQFALKMLKEKVRGDLVNCSEQIYHSSPISAEEMKKTHPDLDLDQMPDASPLFEKEITIDRSSLHIHKDEIASMEKRYPELKPPHPACTDQATLAGPYSLKEAAEESACSENEVIRIAISGKIDLRIRAGGWFQAYIREVTKKHRIMASSRKVEYEEAGNMMPKSHNNGYLAIWPQELMKFLPDNPEAEISEFQNVAVNKTKPGIGWRRYEKNCMGYRVDEDGRPSPVTVKRTDLLIFGPDLLVLKKEVKAELTEFLTAGVEQEEKPADPLELFTSGWHQGESPPVGMDQETEIEMIERLRAEGETNDDIIAAKLKRRFKPQITFFNIAVLIGKAAEKKGGRKLADDEVDRIRKRGRDAVARGEKRLK